MCLYECFRQQTLCNLTEALLHERQEYARDGHVVPWLTQSCGFSSAVHRHAARDVAHWHLKHTHGHYHTERGKGLIGLTTQRAHVNYTVSYTIVKSTECVIRKA